MSDSRYVLVEAPADETWDRYLGATREGTIFSENLYLQALCRPVFRAYVQQGREVKALLCITPTADGAACELDDLVIYGGIMFTTDRQRSPVKCRFERFEITEFLITHLDERYRRIEMPLTPQFEDMRPFLWHHYHDADARLKFECDLRYTSYLSLASLASGDPEASELFTSMETVRRYSVREARRKGGSARQSCDPATLVQFYETLMAEQGQPQRPAKLLQMQRVMDALIRAGRGSVYEVVNKDEVVVYSVMYGWDARRAYYLFGAGHATINEPWQGTLAHWTAFVDLASNRGITEIDLEGVNSPRRGWFKLGFGGTLTPYYHVRKGCA